MSKLALTIAAAATAAAIPFGVGVASAPPAAAATTKTYVCGSQVTDPYVGTVGAWVYIKVVASGKNKIVYGSWANANASTKSRYRVLAVTSITNGAKKALLGNPVVIGTTKTGAAMRVSTSVAMLDMATLKTFNVNRYCGTY